MKQNFRLVSILPTLSITFEKCIFSQISTFSVTLFRINNAVFEKDMYSTLSSGNAENIEEICR